MTEETYETEPFEDESRQRERLIELEATIKVCDMLRESLKKLRDKV